MCCAVSTTCSSAHCALCVHHAQLKRQMSPKSHHLESCSLVCCPCAIHSPVVLKVDVGPQRWSWSPQVLLNTAGAPLLICCSFCDLILCTWVEVQCHIMTVHPCSLPPFVWLAVLHMHLLHYCAWACSWSTSGTAFLLLSFVIILPQVLQSRSSTGPAR